MHQPPWCIRTLFVYLRPLPLRGSGANPAFACPDDGLATAVDIELGVDGRHVVAHGVRRQAQFLAISLSARPWQMRSNTSRSRAVRSASSAPVPGALARRTLASFSIRVRLNQEASLHHRLDGVHQLHFGAPPVADVQQGHQHAVLLVEAHRLGRDQAVQAVAVLVLQAQLDVAHAAALRQQLAQALGAAVLHSPQATVDSPSSSSAW